MCLLRIYTNTQRVQGQYNYRCLLQNTVFFPSLTVVLQERLDSCLIAALLVFTTIRGIL